MCIKGMFVWEDFREEEKLRREQWKESIFSRCLVGRKGGSRPKYSCASARVCHFFARLAFYFILFFFPFPLIFASSSIVLSVFFFLGYQKKKKKFSIFLFCVFFPLLFSPSSSLFYFSFLVLLFIYLFIFVAHFPSCAPLKKFILKCSYNF